MREILFRGQTRRFGEEYGFPGEMLQSEWVYGGALQLVSGPDGKIDENYAIIYTIDRIESRAVHADTVSQYTGKNDAAGRKIFEGDIVDILTDDGEIGVIEWDEYTAKFTIQAAGWCTDFDHEYGKDLQIIGNKWDNPELVPEGGET